MQVTHLPAFEYQRMRWRNQLGWTREVAREVDQHGRETWRVSIAEIDHDSAYSAFPGMRREQVLLEGNGMALTFADDRVARLEPPHGRVAFSGEESPACTLLDGPVRDFNLFYDPIRITATLRHRPLVGSMLIFAEAQSTWLIYLMAGQLRVRLGRRDVSLAQGDSLRLDNPGQARQRLALEGGGELLLLSLAPVAAP